MREAANRLALEEPQHWKASVALQRNAMNARRRRITRAQIRRLEKRVIAQWIERYMGKKGGEKEGTGYREQGRGVRRREERVRGPESGAEYGKGNSE